MAYVPYGGNCDPHQCHTPRSYRDMMYNMYQDLADKSKIETTLWDCYHTSALFRGLADKYIALKIGGRVAVDPKPNYEFLDVDPSLAQDWSDTVVGLFNNYVNSPENWISADRSMNLVQLARQIELNHLITGESFISREWRASPLGYKTCFQIIGSDRVDGSGNDQNVNNRPVIRGVELDKFGMATAYYVRQSMWDRPAEYMQSQEYVRIPRRNRFNRLALSHNFEAYRTQSPRGVSRLSAALPTIQQADVLSSAAAEKNIVTSKITTVLRSERDPGEIAEDYSEVLERNGVGMDPHIRRGLQDGTFLQIGADDEIFDLKTPNIIETTGAVIAQHVRKICNVMGMSFEVGANDFSGVNFSVAQLSLASSEVSTSASRNVGTYKDIEYIYRSWLDEAIARGTVPEMVDRSGRVVPYWENRDMISECVVSGASRINSDPLKTERSNQMAISNGYASMSQIARNNGGDFEAVTDARCHDAVKLTKKFSEAKEKAKELIPAGSVSDSTIESIVQSIVVPTNSFEKFPTQNSDGDSDD